MSLITKKSSLSLFNSVYSESQYNLKKSPKVSSSIIPLNESLKKYLLGLAIKSDVLRVVKS